jgi:WD40 repeat protein
VAKGKELATLKGHTGFVFSVAYSPDGKTLASGSYDKTIKLWDVATGKELSNTILNAYITIFLHNQPFAAAACLSYYLTVHKERATLRGLTGYVLSVAFSPDGKTLASGSGDGTIKLWDVATGKQAGK